MARQLREFLALNPSWRITFTEAILQLLATVLLAAGVAPVVVLVLWHELGQDRRSLAIASANAALTCLISSLGAAAGAGAWGCCMHALFFHLPVRPATSASDCGAFFLDQHGLAIHRGKDCQFTVKGAAKGQPVEALVSTCPAGSHSSTSRLPSSDAQLCFQHLTPPNKAPLKRVLPAAAPNCVLCSDPQVLGAPERPRDTTGESNRGALGDAMKAGGALSLSPSGMGRTHVCH